MSEKADGLQQKAGRIASAASDVRAWINEVKENSTSVRSQSKSLIFKARQLESLARKLGRSAGSRTSVGVFGASQHGKSFLVSTLARMKDATQLRVRFGDETRDFLTDINPGGAGKEATGLVTRFTGAPTNPSTDPEYPVEVRLLSEADIVKVLANSFLNDFDQQRIDPQNLGLLESDKIRGRLEECKPAERQVAAHLGELEVFEISEYFRENFGQSWADLESKGYWDWLIESARFLPLPARSKAFAELWKGLRPFTKLYELLVGELEALGHAREAILPLSALVPKQSSIIDVATLQHLDTANGEQDRLRIKARGHDGKLAFGDIARARVAALVAELQVTLADVPRPAFEEVDLLDFPGARSRKKIATLDDDQQVRELFLRAKIAYLFQRYAEQRELNALLLCMRCGTPHEVKDLGPMVRNWLETTQGNDAQARARNECSLFVILTMADVVLRKQEGDTDEQIGGKWEAQLQTSLIEPFGSDEWLSEFSPGHSFTNVLLLRNPSVKQENVVEYRSGDKLEEISLSLPNGPYIEQMHNAFIGSILVQKHIEAPEAVWQAMLELNDGGARYVVDRLERVCRGSFKDEQVENLLLPSPRQLRENLQIFYHAKADIKRQDEEQKVDKTMRAFANSFAPSKYRRFPHFLSHLMMPEQNVRDLVLTVAASKIDAANHAEAVEDIFAPDAKPDRPEAARRDRAAELGQAICAHWTTRLRQLQQDELQLRYYGLNAADAIGVIDSVIVAADRLNLADTIAESVRSVTQLAAVRWEDIADEVAAIASFSHNAFVAELGFAAIPIERRPTFPPGAERPQRRIFESPAVVLDGQLPVLASEENLALRAAADWAVAFRHIALDNLSYEGGRELTPEQNKRLGALLDRLSA